MDEIRAIRPASRKPRRLPALVRPGRAPVRYDLGIQRRLRHAAPNVRRVPLSVASAPWNIPEDAFDRPPGRLGDRKAEGLPQQNRCLREDGHD